MNNKVIIELKLWAEGMRDSLLVLLFIFFTCTISTAQNYEQPRDYRNLDNSLSTNHNQPTNLDPLNKQTTGTKDVWTELHPKVPRVNYWGVYFMNPDTGLAVGEQGTIIKTKNGGSTWHTIETGYNKTIRTVGSYTGENIIAAGDSGLIIISTDYGETWATIQSSTDRNFWNIQFITEQIGWLVGEGSSAFKTTDGGNTWINQQTPLNGYPYWDVSFIDTSFGFICTNLGGILRTTDGGLSWDVTQVGDNYGLFSIYAITRMKAVALGFAGKHVYTSDGGESWEFITYWGDTIMEIAFLDTLNGFAVGASSFETTDGGLNWTWRTDMDQGIRDITFIDDNIGYCAGGALYAGAGLILKKTTNSGQTWNRTIINDDFTDVFFATSQKGWFIGNQTLYQTTDGVVTLTQRDDFPGSLPSTVYFLDSLNGIIGAQNKIYKTYDGGVSWQEKNINGISGNAGEFNRLFFIDDNIGWSTSYGYVIKTTDGGENWQSQLNIGGLSGIHFSDSLNGWVTRVGGGLTKPFKTTDGGETWIEQINFPSYDTRDVFFNDSLNGFITISGALYKTTDGGINWSIVPNVTDITSPRFSNLKYGTIFLAGGPLTYKSMDSGETWSEVNRLHGELIEYIRLTDVSEGFAVGMTGLILRLSDSVVNVGKNHSQNPGEFHLYQNYPNPFNPLTKIEFKLPKATYTKLTVYNVLGERIIELVNRKLEAGYYEVEFNGDKLPSGTYIYTLDTEKYNESKKMILLK